MCGGCPRHHLRAEERPGHLGRPGHQGTPGLGFGVHQGASTEVVFRRTTLDEVGRQGEGGSREADEGGGSECRDGERDSLGDRAQGRWVEGRERCDILERADRSTEHRAASGHDVDVDPRELDGHDDVAEEDARVDAVAPHRLQGDLAGHGRVEACVEHRGADPQLPILRQRPAGLPHEPDRGRLRAVCAVGANEIRLGGTPVDERMIGWQIHPPSLPAAYRVPLSFCHSGRREVHTAQPALSLRSAG